MPKAEEKTREQLRAERNQLFDALCQMETVLDELEWNGYDEEAGGFVCPVCHLTAEMRIHRQDCSLNHALNCASEAKKNVK